MNLDVEIKQKNFKSEYHKLAVNIIFTHGWLLSHQKEIFDKYDITSTQFNILRILRGQHPNPGSINLLKERMLDKMSDVSRLVERLRVKGLVIRKTCNVDRRKSDVTISDKGLKLLKILDSLDDDFEKLISNISTEEAKTINKLLDKMRY